MVNGRLEIYNGQLGPQLKVLEVELKGKNSILSYPEALEYLRQRGLWPARPQNPVPDVIKRIGLITSRSSKALADFHTAYTNEGGEAEIVEAFAPVQGREAARLIAIEINRFSQTRSVDVIVVTRGGGDPRELAEVFDDVQVAEAICQSALPVITAIGHTTDQTLADHLADDTDITPTSVAVNLARIPTKRGGLFNIWNR